MNKKTKKTTAAPFFSMRREAMRDSALRKEYEALAPEYALIRAFLDARLKRGLTQEEIARKAGTSQSAVARFESGRSNPTLKFASKLSRAVGARLEIRLGK